jgi:hypothetical protein
MIPSDACLIKMLNSPTGPSRSLDLWSSGQTGLDCGLFFLWRSQTGPRTNIGSLTGLYIKK